jgi:hypothetical protein
MRRVLDLSVLKEKLRIASKWSKKPPLSFQG